MLAATLLAAVTARAEPSVFRDWRSLRDADVVRQARDYSCGAAALATLLSRYYGQPVRESDVLDLLRNPSPEMSLAPDWETSGMSFATLASLAAHFGLRSQGLSLSADDLLRLRFPAIAQLQRDGWSHFTVISGIGAGGAVQLADPSWGNRRLGAADFRKLWLDSRSGRGRLLLLLPATEQGISGQAFALDRPQPLLRPFRPAF
jgi:predicted double-glycine peptidase